MIFYHAGLNIIFNLINIYDEANKPLLALEDSEGEFYFFDNNNFIINLEFIGVL